VAEAAAAGARAVADAAQVELDVLTVRAPLDARVLQVELPAGEFVRSAEGC
jgi:multidrug resistance efflux pump